MSLSARTLCLVALTAPVASIAAPLTPTLLTPALIHSAPAPMQKPASNTTSGACFWQLPGKYAWVNLHAIVRIYATKTEIVLVDIRGSSSDVETRYANDIELFMPKIQARLDECGGGSK